VVLEISNSEYKERFKRLQELIAESGLDAFIVSSRDSIFYLTGVVYEPFERPFLIVVRAAGSPSFIVPKLEEENIRGQGYPRVESYWEYPAPDGRQWQDKLFDSLSGAKAIGIEPLFPSSASNELDAFAPAVCDLVGRLRLVKSPTEIEMIRRAAKYADLGIERILASAYYNSTIAEGVSRTRGVELRIIREVDDWEPVSSKVLLVPFAAPRSAQPHSIPEVNDRLKEGSHVAVALTAINGYSAECARTFFTSPPSNTMKDAFNAMLGARELALKRLSKPGIRCSELDAEVNAFLDARGFAGKRLHRTGHGIGLGNHEPPWLAEGSDDEIRPGMIVSIKPGVYIPKGDNDEDAGGVRHSETVLVTNNGAECLTKYRRNLEDLIITRWKFVSRARGFLVRGLLGL
jgi:Xaa-Pro dipeptidase